ncbi:MAG TPA: heavy-metal-associated domain-containing protein [Pusillimonas sp.]|uniref:heavy-metal-associated domain-containing protein n=1 Tax=Pusillimonas sp. TaxID=3040095 RepID=UPI002CE89FC5|nr:heavy-metal-associated domain-containing protein [Pusillimonas sp.]HUH88836.1 heavy-metal-associated domain-containing protein [Pusillimonas sp.]
MLEFRVHDMTCNHCVGAITKAVKNAAPQASVEVDLAHHLVRIQGEADETAVRAAITEAGYTPDAAGA